MKNQDYQYLPWFVLLIMVSLFIPKGLLFGQDSLKVLHKGRHHVLPFVDKNGDGYNDNAPDDDGDGIPNGLDPDWQKQQHAKKKGKKTRFIDLDGDGINDLLFSEEKHGFTDQGKQSIGKGRRKGKLSGMGLEDGGKGRSKKQGPRGK